MKRNGWVVLGLLAVGQHAIAEPLVVPVKELEVDQPVVLNPSVSLRDLPLLNEKPFPDGNMTDCVWGFPELEISTFGELRSVGNDLEVTWYGLTRKRSGKLNGNSTSDSRQAVRAFLDRDWDTAMMSRYYRSPCKIYAPCVLIPVMESAVGPAAFGEIANTNLSWMAHYQGEIVYPEDIIFRLWGVGDEIMVVRVEDQVVFADVNESVTNEYGELWKNYHSQTRPSLLGPDHTLIAGDWVSIKANQPLDIEILLADHGGLINFALLVEVKGVEYELNKQGQSILPVFKTAGLSQEMLKLISKDLVPGQVSLTNGPTFKDY